MGKRKSVRHLSFSRILVSCFFISIFSPLLGFAQQGQQPPVLITFEQFSAPSISQNGELPWGLPPFSVGSATFVNGALVRNQGLWSVDWTNVMGFESSIPMLPIPQDPGDDCSAATSIDFSQKVSDFSAILLNRYDGPPVTYIVCDDQGGSREITLANNASSAISLPDNGIRHVKILIPNRNDYGDPILFAIDDVRFTPIDPVFLDPVDSGFVSGGPQIINSPGLLASGGVVVQNVAADRVTQAVVRIPANHDGESLSVSVYDENGQQGDKSINGGVFQLGGSPGSAQSTLNVTAVHTAKGPMAFAIYLSPTNFARDAQNYPQDQTSSTRAISLQIQSNDDPSYRLTANASVIRPPVILVHGLWGSAGDWGRQGFTIPIYDIDVDTVDYYYPLLKLTATYPSYNPNYLDINKDLIPTSALGFSHNAPLVDGQIRQGITDFRYINNAAAVTADVIAHSMGGDIVRTIAIGSGFKTNNTYGHGPIDKLITIGTPHLGTPLATDLLQGANTCVREQLAKSGNASFITVTTSAGPANGAVGDLQGDGSPPPNGSLSPALGAIWDAFQAGPLPFAMARVSAKEGYSNLSGLDCSILESNCLAARLKARCYFSGDPLATALSSSEWEPLVFGALPGYVVSDAVVPLLSQLNGGTALPATLTGVIHSPGMTKLNFVPPTELDNASGVVVTVIDLLNKSPDAQDFKQ